jgi:nicotinamidase/pyrazinamidase
MYTGVVEINDTDALIVVDVQNDFCPGGALAVPNGDEVVDVINRIAPLFSVVIATQDYHPPGHSSFVEQGGPWPVHCVQGSLGAEFHPALDTSRFDEVIQKGTDLATDGYSGFAGTDLADRLWARGVTRVFVAGLATDYCVRATAVEAIDNGFDTVVVTDAIRAVDVNAGDGAAAIEAMAGAGAALVAADEINS